MANSDGGQKFAIAYHAWMGNTADVIVVGLGAMGTAALYQSAKLGARVLGIDRFDPPHDRGSSHGDTRITRAAIGEGREFVPLVLRSNQIWEELEAATGRNLLTRNGALVLASQNISGNHHGSTSFVQDTIHTARDFDIAHEVLDTDEIRRRYPQFQLSGDEVGYFESGAGFLRPEACVETQLNLARHLGARALTSEVVLDIRSDKHGGVEVKTDRAAYSGARVIVTAGTVVTETARGRVRALLQGLPAGAVLVRTGEESGLIRTGAFSRVHLDRGQPAARHALRLPCD